MMDYETALDTMKQIEVMETKLTDLKEKHETIFEGDGTHRIEDAMSEGELSCLGINKLRMLLQRLQDLHDDATSELASAYEDLKELDKEIEQLEDRIENAKASFSSCACQHEEKDAGV